MSKIKDFYVSGENVSYSVQKEPVLSGELTGYASIDKPWLKNYPEELILARKKYAKKYERIIDKLKDVWPNP